MSGRAAAEGRKLNFDSVEKRLSQPLKPQFRRAILTKSWGEMQYCVILDLDNVTDATAVGILLHRYGYKIVSAQVAPSSCPVQQEVKSCDDCGLITQPAAPTSRELQAE
jgi:hypothetical protein